MKPKTSYKMEVLSRHHFKEKRGREGGEKGFVLNTRSSEAWRERKDCPFQFQVFCLPFHLLSSPHLWLGFTLASASVGFGGSHSTSRSEAHSDSAALSPDRGFLNKMFGETCASVAFSFLLLLLPSPWIASETPWTSSSLMPSLR